MQLATWNSGNTLIALCMVLVFPAWGQDENAAIPAPATAEKAEKTPVSSIEIGRKTTYLTEPRHSRGGIDYIAAIENELGRDVTPENNAVVPLMKAFGPSILPESERKHYFQKLGMPIPPAEGKYFVPLEDYAATRNLNAKDLGEKFSRIIDQHDNPDEFLGVRDWLKSNQTALDLVVEATQRSGFYAPLVVEVKGNRILMGADFPVCQRIREASRALLARAKFALHDKDFDRAWNDILACHVLARLVNKKPFAFTLMISAAMDAMTHHHLVHFVNSCPKADPRAGKRFEDFRQHPFEAEYLTVLESERLILLDSIMLASRGDLPALIPDEKTTGMLEALANQLGLRLVDWSVVLIVANVFHDEIDAVHRELPSPLAFQDLLETNDILAEWKTAPLAPEVGTKALETVIPPKLRQEMSVNFAQKIIASATTDFARMYRIYRRQKVRNDFSHLILALEAYTAKKKRLPETLRALVPAFLPEVPQPPFSHGKYLYVRINVLGYTLWGQADNLIGDAPIDQGPMDIEAHRTFPEPTESEDEGEETTPLNPPTVAEEADWKRSWPWIGIAIVFAILVAIGVLRRDRATEEPEAK